MNSADLVVIGGGLAGCMAAIQAARLGLNAVLVEKREYPGREVAAYNHTFVDPAGEEQFNLDCPQWLTRLFGMRNDQEAQAPSGLVRQWLIEELEEAGVTVLYNAAAVGATRDGGGLSGVILGTPLGIFHLPVRKVLDATERCNLLRLLEGKPYISGGIRVNATLDMENVDLAAWGGTGFSNVEEKLALVKGSVKLHPSARRDTTLIEFAFIAEADSLYSAKSRLETARVAKSWQLSSYLRDHIPGFAQAHVNHLAYDSLLTEAGAEQADSREPEASPKLTAASGLDASARQALFGGAKTSAGGNDSLEGLRSLTPLPWGFSLGDVARAWAEAGEAADWAKGNDGGNDGQGQASVGQERLILGKVILPFDRNRLFAYEDDGMAIQLYKVPAELVADQLPEAEQTDVCVIGLGAGGGMAMLAAAESGRKVAAIEVHTLFGGTHTVGRVIDYYDGYRQGMSRKAGEAANVFAQTKRELKEQGGVPYAAYLNHCAEKFEVDVYSGTIACGALLSGNQVCGVIAANEDGLFTVKAQVTIDATGNADMIDFAGVGYELGDDETGMVQSYSLWGMELYPFPSYLMHRFYNDPGICHPDRYSERLRAIRDGHCKNSPHHISPMVTVRESRRMEGEHYLTVRDILDDKTYSDVIAVASTRADSHAFTSSPLARLGSLGAGRKLQLRLPYGCFIPRGKEGLLVAAKAMSGERDATSFCRMNADIKNAGYAIGLAAAMAAEKGSGVRNIDLPALQRKLAGMDILPDWAFAAPQPPDTTGLTEQAAAGDEEALLALLRRPADQALPVLEELYRAGKRGYTAHALAWFGSSLGGGEIADQLADAVNRGRHRTLPMHNMYSGLLRWGRYYGDDFTLVNRLAMFAGHSSHPDPLQPLSRLIADTEGYGPMHPWMFIYDQEREDMVQYPFYERILNIAAAAARRADTALSPALDVLLNRKGVTGYAVELHSIGHSNYMLAHAEISLARAAVRCGSARGREALATYLNDKHSFFRRTARRELSLEKTPERGEA